MKKSLETKLRILNTFRSLAIEEPFHKVTVQRVVTECNSSRKAFYYHFTDFGDLIRWGFRYELSLSIAQYCDTDQTVVPRPWMKDPYPSLAYYARKPVGARSLDCSNFFCALGNHLESQREYYKAVLRCPFRKSSLDYVAKLYRVAFCEDIKFISGGRYIREEDMMRLVDFFLAEATAGYLFEIENGTGTPLPKLAPETMPNIRHDSLYSTVNRYLEANATPYRVPNTVYRNRVY